MKRKILICTILICSMLLQICPVSMASVGNSTTIDLSYIETISDLCIMEDNMLPDGTAINPAEHSIYLKGGFTEGCLHVASRTFTISNIADTDLIGCDLIGYGHDTYKDDTSVTSNSKIGDLVKSI